jgi:hypothetical protein
MHVIGDLPSEALTNRRKEREFFEIFKNRAILSYIPQFPPYPLPSLFISLAFTTFKLCLLASRSPLPFSRLPPLSTVSSRTFRFLTTLANGKFTPMGAINWS